MGITIEALMLRLLPVAKSYAKAPISNFSVGAVANALLGKDVYGLFLGANIEFPGLPLNQTIHAEQTATINALQNGATGIQSIATSAAPCGHCRQFLYEFEGRDTLTIITKESDNDSFSVTPLPKLLPRAFGPIDLNISKGLMSSSMSLEKITLKSPSDDPLVLEALSAACRSYAPYSHNIAGCAIELRNGKIYSGSYIESAAFNPSLSPFHTAIISMNMAEYAPSQIIARAVLVESPTDIAQRITSEMLINTLAPQIPLEYHEAF
jgi:cytidine deaminase